MYENRNKNKAYNSYNSYGGNSKDIEIRAPFNFVPVAETVYHPYKKGKDEKSFSIISHDVPFKDGISGKISFSFTAETPIFTKDADTENGSSFNFIIDSEGKRKYFIPASSVKGCIRNVLEIMSFGKMSKVDNKSFGLRDLNNKEYTSKIKDVHCGWMEIRDEIAYVEDWGVPGRISIDEISKELGVKELREFVKNDNFNNLARRVGRDKVTSPLYKYNMLKGKDLTYRFSTDKTSYSRKIYKFDRKGKEGTIVFTGQNSGRKVNVKRNGKYYEFVFFKPQTTPKTLSVDEKVLKAFHTIHENSPAYVSLWSEKLKKGERVPVFFMLDDAGKISSIGLSFMYKYPYDKATYSAMPKEMLEKELDLAESLFGYTDKESAMRGRVQFSHAMAVSDGIVPLKSREFPAYSPHSSYYPIYVKGGKDWNHANRIAGWKRYLIQSQPVYKDETARKSEKKGGMEDKIKTTTDARFLPAGTKFDVTVRFQNLRPFELGALLSAITFHGHQDKCFHAIGFGKAYGYGKIKIGKLVLSKLEYDEDHSKFNKVESIQEYLDSYEKVMKTFNPGWMESPQLKELMAIAGGWNKNVGYMSLEDYREAKKNRDERGLKPFSKLNPDCFRISTAADGTSSGAGFAVGQEVIAKCVEEGKVRIDGNEGLIMLGLKKTTNARSLIGKRLKVRINQVSSTGAVTHVSFIAIV